MLVQPLKWWGGKLYLAKHIINLLLPKQACSHLHLCPYVSQNGRI